MKKSDADKGIYDRFFAGQNFAVPPILDGFRVGDANWITMPYIPGEDARYCTPEESRRVGEAQAKIQSHYLSPDANPEGCRAYFDHYTGR